MRRGSVRPLAVAAALLLSALAAVVLLGLPGTSGGGAPVSAALASLRAPEYDPDFGLEYWTGQLIDGAREWDRALAFCRGHSSERYPNCRTIRLLETVGQVPGFPGVSPGTGSDAERQAVSGTVPGRDR